MRIVAVVCPSQESIKSDPYVSLDDCVEFRLTYDGLLLGASRTDTRASHKQDIRRHFSKQLRRLWDTNSHLKEISQRVTTQIGPRQFHTGFSEAQKLGMKFKMGKWLCVPLATEELELVCGLDILFLRPDQPGMTLVRSGDIDNRLKTLFDALRLPHNQDEALGDPGPGESPLFCLMEDDKLITHLAVTTDILLEPEKQKNDVRLIITVRIKPTAVTMANIPYAF
jgi:hypothetical protein